MTEPLRPLAALQATLSAEHAAVFVYAALGGRVSSVEAPVTAERLRAAYEVHRARRDHLRSVIADLGAKPVAAEPGYQVDVSSRESEEMLRVARLTEERCAGHYAQLVASSVDGQRSWAVEALTDAAVRLLGLGAEPDPYPGAPELRAVT